MAVTCVTSLKGCSQLSCQPELVENGNLISTRLRQAQADSFSN